MTTVLLGTAPGPYRVLVVIALLAGNARGMETMLAATAVSNR